MEKKEHSKHMKAEGERVFLTDRGGPCSCACAWAAAEHARGARDSSS
jgi:hypothetical protein